MGNSALDAILSQYEKNTEKSSKVKISNEDRLKKYFTEKLQKGDKSATRTFRILPGKDGNSPFDEAYFHEKQVNGKYEKIYCPKLNDGEHCPLCEVSDELFKSWKETGNKADKELATQYSAKKFYLARLIDRSKEDDGVKFWRFPHNYKGEGALDKIIPLFTKRGDITDPREGRDVTLILP